MPGMPLSGFAEPVADAAGFGRKLSDPNQEVA